MRYRASSSVNDVLQEEYVLDSMSFPVEGAMEYEAVMVSIPEFEEEGRTGKTVGINAERLLQLKKCKDA